MTGAMPLASWALISTIAIVVPCCVASLQVYPLDWSTVPAVPAATNLTVNCTCDIERFVCNIGCCCDPDCIPPVVAATRASLQCLPEGVPPETLDYCVPNSYVAKVNLPGNSDFYQITVTPADNKFISQLLCITRSSNPSLGDSYPDPVAGNEGDNQALASCPVAPSAPVLPASYQYQTPVYVQRGGAKLPLTLPYPAFSQLCADGIGIGFLNNVPESLKDTYQTCSRSLSTGGGLGQLCSPSSPLAPEFWTGLRFYPTPAAQEATLVTVDSVQLLNSSNSGLASLPANTTITWDGFTCRNVARFINLTIFYTWLASDEDPEGTASINKVSVGIITADVASTAAALQQSWRLQFTRTVEAGAGVRVLQPFSGAPGYLPGLPLLAGVLATFDPTGQGVAQKTAVERLVGGLPIPGPGEGGVCAPLATSPAVWGFNATSSCAIPLTADDLRLFCQTQVSNPQLLYQTLVAGVYNTLVSSQLYLGIWGNSNFTQINQWVQVKVSNYPFNNLIYSASENSCANVVVGFDLQILSGVAFSSNNLQNKLLFANLCFRTATWAFPSGRPVNQTYQFLMTSTVSFIAKQQAKQTGLKRPAPPLLVPLSRDIFYPFVTSAAPSRAASLAVSIAMVLLGSSLRLLAC
ncbi:hypothetical protein V8C86DRAFT_2556402 [Haematococcus lacustris]